MKKQHNDGMLNSMDANIKYKDSVFSFLFSDPDLLRELYCALEGVDLPPNVPVIINTLQNVLFMPRVAAKKALKQILKSQGGKFLSRRLICRLPSVICHLQKKEQRHLF